MKFSYLLSIASMMILLFVSGLSIVRSEEAPDSGKMKGLLKKLTEKKNMKTQKIQATCTPTSSYQYLGFSYYTCYDLSSCPGSTCSNTYTYNGVSCCLAYNAPADDDDAITCTPTSSTENDDDEFGGSTSYTCYDLSTCPGSTCTSTEYTNGVSCCTEYKDALL
jgi:hypothetical protein